jgi:hypothetical protein
MAKVIKAVDQKVTVYGTADRNLLFQSAKQSITETIGVSDNIDTGYDASESTASAVRESNVEQDTSLSLQPSLKHFRFLAHHLAIPTQTVPGTDRVTSITDEPNDYLQDIPSCDTDDGIQYGTWLHRTQKASKLSSFALDILSAPSSEAYVERLVSVCVDLTTGKRNRTNQSLERKVFMKVNEKFMLQ